MLQDFLVQFVQKFMESKSLITNRGYKMKYILILSLIFVFTGCNDGFSFNSGPPTCESQFNNFSACVRQTFNNISCEQWAMWGMSGESEQAGSQIAQVCMQQNTLPDFKQKCRQKVLSELPEFIKNLMSDGISRCE